MINFKTKNDINLKKVSLSELEMEDSNEDISIIFCNIVTTSIIPSEGQIARLNLKLCYANKQGKITKFRKTISFFEEVSTETSEEQKKYFDFDISETRGKSIDWNLVANLMNQSDLIVSHNSSFVRPWLRKYLEKDENVWSCSMEKIDWQERGFSSRNLETLSLMTGNFYDFESSIESLDAVIFCLVKNNVFSKFLQESFKPDIQLFAANAPIEYKDNLKVRGYRWNPELKCWWKLMKNKEESLNESKWLEENIPSVEPQSFEVGLKFRFIQ